MPKFETEAQEAEWWFENQDLIAEEFARVKPKLGPSRSMQKLMEYRAAQQAEAKPSKAEAEPLPKLPRSA